MARQAVPARRQRHVVERVEVVDEQHLRPARRAEVEEVGELLEHRARAARGDRWRGGATTPGRAALDAGPTAHTSWSACRPAEHVTSVVVRPERAGPATTMCDHSRSATTVAPLTSATPERAPTAAPAAPAGSSARVSFSGSAALRSVGVVGGSTRAASSTIAAAWASLDGSSETVAICTSASRLPQTLGPATARAPWPAPGGCRAPCSPSRRRARRISRLATAECSRDGTALRRSAVMATWMPTWRPSMTRLTNRSSQLSSGTSERHRAAAEERRGEAAEPVDEDEDPRAADRGAGCTSRGSRPAPPTAGCRRRSSSASSTARWRVTASRSSPVATSTTCGSGASEPRARDPKSRPTTTTSSGPPVMIADTASVRSSVVLPDAARAEHEPARIRPRGR